VRSPVIELNRAVAVGMAEGPQAGIDVLDEIGGAPELAAYHHLPAVRGDFLQKLGRLKEARQAFEAAAHLATNARERAMIERRAAGLSDPDGSA